MGGPCRFTNRALIVRFTLPAPQVAAHSVGELTILLPAADGASTARLRQLRLTSPTRWW